MDWEEVHGFEGSDVPWGVPGPGEDAAEWRPSDARNPFLGRRPMGETGRMGEKGRPSGLSREAWRRDSKVVKRLLKEPGALDLVKPPEIREPFDGNNELFGRTLWGNAFGAPQLDEDGKIIDRDALVEQWKVKYYNYRRRRDSKKYPDDARAKLGDNYRHGGRHFDEELNKWVSTDPRKGHVDILFNHDEYIANQPIRGRRVADTYETITPPMAEDAGIPAVETHHPITTMPLTAFDRKYDHGGFYIDENGRHVSTDPRAGRFTVSEMILVAVVLVGLALGAGFMLGRRS